MKSASTALAVCVLVAGILVSPPGAGAQPGVVRAGVVKITAQKLNQPVEIGAGIILGFGRGVLYIATAYHVVEDAEIVTVEFYGEARKFRGILFERIDRDRDLAVVTIPGEGRWEGLVVFEQGDVAALKPADPTTVIGHPHGGAWVASVGRILSWDASHVRFTRDETVGPGNSGGPLLTGRSQLMGMVTERGPEVGIALRVDVLVRLLDEWNIPYRMKVPVDFCPTLLTILEGAWNDFEGWGRGPARPYGVGGSQWRPKLDLSGIGDSRIVAAAHPIYEVEFESSLDDATRARDWEALVQKLDGCLRSRYLRNVGEIGHRHYQWTVEEKGFLGFVKGFITVNLAQLGTKFRLRIDRD